MEKNWSTSAPEPLVLGVVDGVLALGESAGEREKVSQSKVWPPLAGLSCEHCSTVGLSGPESSSLRLTNNHLGLVELLCVGTWCT